MVVFDELRVTRDGENIIIKARVRPESYYRDVYVDKIIIDTEETYQEGSPSNSPVYTKTIPSYQKEVSLIISKNDLLVSDIKEHLLFIYVVTSGVPLSDTPCGMDNKTTLAVTMHLGDFYNTVMYYLKDIKDNCCSIPQDLIDYLLKFKALNISIDAGHYIQGINYFNKWFTNKHQSVVLSNCGCNG